MAAFAGATALASLPLARGSDDVVSAGIRVDALALLALGVGLALGWPFLIPTSLVLLAGVYGAELAVDDAPLDEAAPIVAAGLFVTAELAYWSLDARERVSGERGDDLRRVGFLAGVAVATLLVGTTLLALVDGVRARGLAIDVVGAIAAVAALLAVAYGARRPAR